MGYLYLPNLDEWRNWDTTPAQWLILDNSGMLDPANQQWVSEVNAGEVVVPGYTRQPVAGQVRTVDAGLTRITYDCDDPDFGTLATGPPYLSLLVLAYDSGDDATSQLLVSFALDFTATDPAAVNPYVSPTGVHWTAPA